MRRYVPFLFVLAFVAALPALAQSGWEGNAVVGAQGEFPDEGLYAASNSFPRNRTIEVENLDTGDTATVVVSKRVEQPGIFLVLSGEAARELGLERGESARVAARPQATDPGRLNGRAEQPRSPDPDVNPAAELGAEPEDEPEDEPEEAPSIADLPTEEAPAEDVPAEEPPPEEPREPTPAPAPRRGIAGGVDVTASRLVSPRRASEVGRAEPRPAEPPEPAEEPVLPSTALADRRAGVGRAVQAVRDRLPERERRTPTVEDGVATFLSPPPRDEEELDTGERVARVPDPPPEVAAERPAAEYLGRLSPPLEEVPDELPEAVDEPEPDEGPEVAAEEPAETTLPPAVRREDELREEIPDDAIVKLESAEERPPEKPEAEAEAPEEDEEEPPAEEPPADVSERPEEPDPEEVEPEEAEPQEAGELPVVEKLESGRFYLQVGAYAERNGAQAAVAQLGAEYPVEVLTEDTREGEDQMLYRVLVGPLSEDERGSVLYMVRAKGYRDAFIRRGPRAGRM